MAMLGQQQQGQLFTDVLPWLLLLLALVVVGGAIIYYARRMINSESESTVDDFTLHGLRTLHAEGQLSDEEFERAKAAMIERVKRASATESDEDDSTDGQPDVKPSRLAPPTSDDTSDPSENPPAT